MQFVTLLRHGTQKRANYFGGLFIFKHYADPQQQFLDFVLDHYISDGVGELDMEKLPDLIKAKYQTVRDIPIELGSIAEIRKVFVGFQAYLYSGKEEL